MRDTLSWRWSRFDTLTVFELDAIYRARQQVFSVEQACAYLDADSADARSHHLSAWRTPDDSSLAGPVAYARVVAPGVKYPEPSIGRVLISAGYRGTGLGRELVRRAVSHCREHHPAQDIRISAQDHLQAFYAAAGFRTIGETYLEDGIVHIDMERPAQ